MVYVAADGSVGGSKSLYRLVLDFFGAIYTLFMLFFTTITNPSAVENHASSSTRTYGNRNQGRSFRPSGRGQSLGKAKGQNIRGVSRLGGANCKMGG